MTTRSACRRRIWLIRCPRATGAAGDGSQIGRDVGDALAHAHQHEVLHRDIKPADLILDRAETVWVADFGLAKIFGHDDASTAEGVVGTLRFMAPERFDGWADPRSDIYGLGMTLYELAALRPAFGEAERGELIARMNRLTLITEFVLALLSAP